MGATNRLDATFERLKNEGKKALIPYLMAGDPSLIDTETLVVELEGAGADIIELGVPFSDPIADGPVIQKAAERALRSGTSLLRILDTIARLRTRTQIPLVLMAYYNTIHAMGERAFCSQAVKAGVDGLIVPDMPVEEATPLSSAASSEGGPLLIFLLAPTSTSARRTQVARRSQGFVYYVSLTGITGAKLADVEDVRRNVAKIRRVTHAPIAIGFGIATPQEAAKVATIADGVIVGSAIVRRVAELQHNPGLPEHIGQFIQSLQTAINPVSRSSLVGTHWSARSCGT
ncbi:MAG TPA: tryptophan synthase subunit alpha [Nitrospiraceae bacterium]|nr:tryptophan synthase subunit alpha [Nitrospiraceae bacterium]